MYVFCDKTFAQNNEMKIHEKNHTGENLMCVLFVKNVCKSLEAQKFSLWTKDDFGTVILWPLIFSFVKSILN